MPTESEYFLGVVATVVRLLGTSNRELEVALGWSAGYLSRLLSGEKSFRFDHLVDLARALGLAPQELVWIAYPESGEPFSDAAEQLWRAMTAPGLAPVPLAGDGRPLPAPAASEDKLEEVVDRVLARMLAKLVPLAAQDGELPPPAAKARQARPRRNRAGTH